MNACRVDAQNVRRSRAKSVDRSVQPFLKTRQIVQNSSLFWYY
jgi:hypothetical protein